MKTKNINISLGYDEIHKLNGMLKEYADNLQYKCDLYVKRLGELGIPIIEENYNKAMGDHEQPYATYVTLHSFGNYSEAVLTLEGKEVLFVEFGAGIYYNNGNNNPYASKLGYGVGTYPDQKFAINPGHWWYKDGERLRFSLGTEATMPMYKAWSEIEQKFVRIAEEVFEI